VKSEGEGERIDQKAIVECKAEKLKIFYFLMLTSRFEGANAALKN